MRTLALALLAALAGCAGASRGLRAAPGALEFPNLDESYARPRPADPACLPRALAERIRWTREGRLVVRFPVDADGRAGECALLANTLGADPALLAGVCEAVGSCAWTPAQDPQGRAVQVFAVLPIAIEEARGH